jgi:hypothetical protein
VLVDRDRGVRVHGHATPQDPRLFQKAKPARLHSAPLGPVTMLGALPNGASLNRSTLPRLQVYQDPTLIHPLILCFGVGGCCLYSSFHFPGVYIRGFI